MLDNKECTYNFLVSLILPLLVCVVPYTATLFVLHCPNLPFHFIIPPQNFNK